jgi:hypothetical protein
MISMYIARSHLGGPLLKTDVFFAIAFVFATASPAHAAGDGWESPVDGMKSYTDVKAVLAYKASQAAEIESIFYGLRDSLYIMRPTSSVRYVNSYLTPSSVTYTVDTQAEFNDATVAGLSAALRDAKYLLKGDTSITFKFGPDTTRTIKVYNEVLPIYEDLVRGGYAFEARAVLLDGNQGIVATSDNSLLLSTPSNDRGLDFSGAPLLRTYELQKAPDLSEILLEAGEGGKLRETPAFRKLQQQLSLPMYTLSSARTAAFYSLPVEDLKRIVSCRVLRDSDLLLLYKERK